MAPPNGNGAGSAILARLDTLEKKIDALMRHFGLGANGHANSGAKSGGEVADLRDIQGDYGDPKIGKMPKNWKGASFEGYTASQCTPDFLDFWADFLDYKADNPRPGKEKYADYDRRDARRCRRWAVEIRAGRHKVNGGGGGAPPPDTEWSAGNLPPPDDGYGPPLPPDDGLPPPPDGDDDCQF